MKIKDLSIAKIKELVRDPLFYNGFFLFMSYAISAPLSILFYKIATSFYSDATFGIAVSIISLMTWVGFFSRIGINLSVRRFLPDSENKNDLINTSVSLVSSSGVFIGFFVFLIASFVVDNYDFIRQDFLVFFSLLLLVVFNNIITIYDAIVVSTRKSIILSAKFILNIALNIGFIILLSDWGVKGYIYSFTIAIIPITIGLVITASVLLKQYKFRPKFNKEIIKRVSRFSISNYYISIIANFRLLIPTILLFIATPESAAHFAIVMVAVNLVYYAFSSFGTSLMVESVHDREQFKNKIVKAIKLTLAIIIPMVVVVILLGKLFLGIYGQAYIDNGYMLFVLCLLTAVPGTIKLIYMNICYVTEKLKGAMIFQTIEVVLTLAGFFILFPFVGLTSFGISWLSVIVVVSAILLVYVIKFMRSESSTEIPSLRS